MTPLTTFVITTWLLAMLPGVGQALMLRQTLVHGRSVAWATIAGTSAGLVLWSVTTACGLSALLLANDAAYALLRLAGGCFLAFVGLRSLLSGPHDLPEISAPGQSASLRQAFLAGLATNLGNPKAGVFALSLLPQFVPATGPVFLPTLGLGIVWALVTGTWYVVFVWLVQRFRRRVVRPGAQRMVQRSTGVVLLALGAGVVLGA
jgi:threonine/homoserine/homoserine lactone efflux protein